MQAILVTGGAGYIGSHTCVELLNADYELVVADNLCNSHPEAINRVRRLTGKDFPFYHVDIRDLAAMDKIFQRHDIGAAVHFAGFKAVGESVRLPLDYYRNNLDSTLILCEAMQRQGVKTLVFSSSATVYGTPASVPVCEDAPLSGTSPYGWSKLMNEQILRDLAAADCDWSVILLRYFNPAGAHPSGLIGEDPAGTPNNLFPYVSQVALGLLSELQVFGSDYPTPDGTGIRDYIHVVDLALGHVRAIEYANTHRGVEAFNLGTGSGYSVLEIAKTFARVSGHPVPCQIGPRRPGDVARSIADPSKAKRLLGWEARRGLEAMCADTWRWQQANPHGYSP